MEETAQMINALRIAEGNSAQYMLDRNAIGSVKDYNNELAKIDNIANIRTAFKRLIQGSLLDFS